MLCFNPRKRWDSTKFIQREHIIKSMEMLIKISVRNSDLENEQEKNECTSQICAANMKNSIKKLGANSYNLKKAFRNSDLCKNN